MKNRTLVRLASLLVVVVIAAVVALVALILATSSPPTLFRNVASPNTQVQVLASGDRDPDIQLLRLAYRDTMRSRSTDPECDEHGRWDLIVNPQDVVGHPYAASPRLQDWIRASRAIATVNTICSAQIALTWYEHDLSHPTSDRWTTVLPAAAAVGIDGPTLRRYAVRHARQV